MTFLSNSCLYLLPLVQILLRCNALEIAHAKWKEIEFPISFGIVCKPWCLQNKVLGRYWFYSFEGLMVLIYLLELSDGRVYIKAGSRKQAGAVPETKVEFAWRSSTSLTGEEQCGTKTSRIIRFQRKWSRKPSTGISMQITEKRLLVSDTVSNQVLEKYLPLEGRGGTTPLISVSSSDIAGKWAAW